MRAAAAAGVPYGLVLLALEMPGMSGLEVAQAVDADPALAGSHIVLLTPFGRQAVETSHPLACVVGTVAKPVRASVLRAGLRSFLGEASPAPAPRPALRAKRSAARARPAAARILVVEDDVDIQTVTAHSLRKVGYRVDVVGTGIEAVHAVARVPYDLVLMDSRLPGMDGLQATRAIRERERGTDRHLRIVALTAGTTDEDRFRAAGMDAVLRKPVRLRSLLETVAAWSGGDPSRRSG
jgi:CheY-like chemotaxis protein